MANMAQSPNGYAGHQMPPLPPIQQQQSYTSQNSQQAKRPGARPSSKSGFSFHSGKSRGSIDNPKIDLHESPREKAARRLSTKADPRMALSEAEPSALAADHSTVLGNLRAMQHRGPDGLPIADPDRSNPTRSRWERPLDTIRSFEAAIDGNYARKSSRSEAPESRRGSYYAASTVRPMKQSYGRQDRNGYGSNYSEGRYNGSYENRNNTGYGNGNGYGNGYESRPDSYYGNNESNNGYYPNRQRIPRNGSEPMLNGGYYEDTRGNGAVYPPNGNPQSYETVTTASGSGSSSDRAGYETHPSSENSSFDRMPVSRKPVNYAEEYPQAQQAMGDYFNQPQQEQYDLRSPGQDQVYLNKGYAQQQQQQQQQQQAPPPVPQHQYQQQQQQYDRPMPPPKGTLQKMNSSAGRPAANGGEKDRKSWFGKKFGRK